MRSALRFVRGSRFVPRGLSLILVGVTSLVGMAVTIIITAMPTNEVTPTRNSGEPHKTKRDPRIVFRLALLFAGSGGRMLISGRCGFSSVCSAAPLSYILHDSTLVRFCLLGTSPLFPSHNSIPKIIA